VCVGTCGNEISAFLYIRRLVFYGLIFVDPQVYGLIFVDQFYTMKSTKLMHHENFYTYSITTLTFIESSSSLTKSVSMD